MIYSRNKQRNFQPLTYSQAKTTWWQKILHWLLFFRKAPQQRRFDRIAKMREQISPLLTCRVPRKEMKIDYSAYEKQASSEEIKRGKTKEDIVTDENNVIYVDRAHLDRLLHNIAKGNPSTRYAPKQEVPHVIGLWSDEVEGWVPEPKRIDTEEEYFACHFHAMSSYIDDEWSEEEQKGVWSYLNSRKIKLNNIIVGAPYWRGSGDFRICTDGKYFWHESLEDLVLKYNVRPPGFFVLYILAQIKDGESVELNDSVA